MIWLLGSALAQDCPPAAEAIHELRREATPGSYDCTVELGPAALIDAAAEPLQNPERITRALAVYRLRHLDEAISPEEAWTYRPGDLRLLVDGVHAHRGRKSPSDAHVFVFDQMDWYSPNPQYTDGLLTDLDRANIEMLKNPPLPTADPTAAEAMASGADAPARSESPCACTTASLGPWALAGLILLRRRDRRPSGGRGTDARSPRG